MRGRRLPADKEIVFSTVQSDTRHPSQQTGSIFLLITTNPIISIISIMSKHPARVLDQKPIQRRVFRLLKFLLSFNFWFNQSQDPFNQFDQFNQFVHSSIYLVGLAFYVFEIQSFTLCVSDFPCNVCATKSHGPPPNTVGRGLDSRDVA